MLIAGCRTLERRNFVLLSPVAGGELCCTLPPHKRRKCLSAGRSNKLSFVTHPSTSPSLFLQPDPSFGASDRFDSNKRRERERDFSFLPLPPTFGDSGFRATAESLLLSLPKALRRRVPKFVKSILSILLSASPPLLFLLPSFTRHLSGSCYGRE